MNNNSNISKHDEESLLLAEINRGEIERAYKFFIGKVFKYVLSFLNGNLFLAEECANDIFIQLYRRTNANKNRPDKHFGSLSNVLGWLITTAKNRCIDECRKLKGRNGRVRRFLLPIGEGDSMDLEYIDSTAEESEVIAMFYHLGLEDCLKNLPPAYKEVVECICIKNYTFRKTAAYLQINVNTAAGRYKRAAVLIITRICEMIGLDPVKYVSRMKSDYKKSNKNDSKKEEG